MEGGDWTLFSPSTCPDLHDKFGSAFERPTPATRQGRARRDQAVQAHAATRPLAQDALDAVRDRPSLDHLQGRLQHPLAAAARGRGALVNLCTEITLNTNESEIAVCNLGSVNLVHHIKDGQIDQAKLKKTVATAMRMLDNVIDINYYAVKKARDSNLRHRPVGLGIMGFQDALHELRVPYASQAAVEFADRSMEAVCYHAYWARPSSLPSAAATPATAARCGSAASCRRTRWTCSPSSVAARRRRPQRDDGLGRLRGPHQGAWQCATRIASHRPTATISNIIGVSASIEPSFGNLSVKSNLSGEFTVLTSTCARPEEARASGTT
jgi:ribonucleoside-diphosphate reductase alpha chain